MAGTTRAAAKARTRAVLLSAARRVFAERGYGEASVDEIARTAGVSVGSVYVHFVNKEALFTALLEESTPPVVEPRPAATPRDRDALFAALDEQVTRDADSREAALLDAEMWLYAVRHPEFAERLAAHEGRIAAGAADVVAAEWGDIDPAVRAALTNQELVTAAAALYHGLLRLRRVFGDDAVPSDLYSRTLKLVLRLG